jgi:hypothetical protein
MSVPSRISAPIGTLALIQKILPVYLGGLVRMLLTAAAGFAVFAVLIEAVHGGLNGAAYLIGLLLMIFGMFVRMWWGDKPGSRGYDLKWKALTLIGYMLWVMCMQPLLHDLEFNFVPELLFLTVHVAITHAVLSAKLRRRQFPNDQDQESTKKKSSHHADRRTLVAVTVMVLIYLATVFWVLLKVAERSSTR